MIRAASVAIIVLLATTCFGDTIFLKSGRKIECDSAWEEGKEVKYVVAAGTVGIPRSMVDHIVKSAPEGNAAETNAPKVSGAATTDTMLPAAREKQSSIATMKLAQSYSKQGTTQFQKKDFVGALESYKKAHGYVKNSETTYNLAVTYHHLKDDWNASLLFSDLLRLEPRNTTALNYLGEIAWRKENLREAQSFWEESYRIKKDPEIKAKLERLKKERKASDSYDDSSTRHFLIKYDGGTADPLLVYELTDFLELTFQDLSSKFEEYPNAPFVVVLYPQKDYFNITDAPGWSGGVNDGKIKLPIRGVDSLNEELKRVLIHELAHSFIDIKTGNNCPVWLHEGLAQYLEGKRPGELAGEGLRKMAEQNGLPRMEQLRGSFQRADSKEAGVLYLLSLSFTQFLMDHYGYYEINSLLQELGKGVDFDTAFENNFLIPISEIESRWRRRLMEE